MLLIDDLFLAPIKLVVWLGEKINETAEYELFDEGRIKERLIHLQQQLEIGQISEEEYDKQEKELLARLETTRASKEMEE